ncbi:MAG: hypothetical protein H7329_06180 [Opitutaceae bacterium]|nr:hypothetical protein [Cytophagales bacterium]
MNGKFYRFYKLKSLQEVVNCPGFPSSSDVELNGYELVKMINFASEAGRDYFSEN